MATRRIANGANALHEPFEVQVEAVSTAPATAVYALLADPSSHLVWAGEWQGKKTRLLSIDGPAGPVGIGDEFATTGADPIGGFADRSVVTEATAPTVFEFVTEATFTDRRGREARWTNVHRYELTPTDGGCRIGYRFRVTRISALPGMLSIFNLPVLRTLAIRASAKVTRRGVANLATLAQERSAA